MADIMAGLTHLFEPEELIGGLWHRLVADRGSQARYPDAGVALNDMRRRLEIFFRGLGGSGGVAIKAIAPQAAGNRRSFLTRIAHGCDTVTQARFDGDHLFLPELIDVLPARHLNEQLYKWLTAWAAAVAAAGAQPETGDDPLRNDIQFIRFALTISSRVADDFPGMGQALAALRAALLANRPARQLPPQEAAIESCIRAALADHPPGGAALPIWQAILDPDAPLDAITAAPRYKTFLPLILWGDVTPPTHESHARRDTAEHDGATAPQIPDGRTRKARRKKSSEIERNDPLVINRFEAILSWAEMLNINRAVEDDEEDAARKAADDQQELGLANISRKTATKLKFDLDLAPEDVEHERLAAKYVYPEWDYRRNSYHGDHCRVLAAVAPQMTNPEDWQPDAAARRRIRAVKRQFEALRPKRRRLHRQIDGNDIDMDAAVRARCDLAASGAGSARVFTSVREAARDLAVSVLIDTSRSSESWIEGRQVIEISKEALLAMTIGLAACGDDNAIYSFSSLRRDRVNVLTLKAFDEPLSPRVFSRIAALRPGFYTRLGAALRHVSKELNETASAKRLLLVLSDGKPNDLDHYEGRYGIEDTAMAVREARRNGISVFGITIDKKAQSYFPHIFGAGAFAITAHAGALTTALPKMYRHLVS